MNTEEVVRQVALCDFSYKFRSQTAVATSAIFYSLWQFDILKDALQLKLKVV